MYYIGFTFWKTLKPPPSSSITLGDCMLKYVDNTCTTLFVRKSYVDLFKKILEQDDHLDHDRHHKLIKNSWSGKDIFPFIHDIQIQGRKEGNWSIHW